MSNIQNDKQTQKNRRCFIISRSNPVDLSEVRNASNSSMFRVFKGNDPVSAIRFFEETIKKTAEANNIKEVDRVLSMGKIKFQTFPEYEYGKERLEEAAQYLNEKLVEDIKNNFTEPSKYKDKGTKLIETQAEDFDEYNYVEKSIIINQKDNGNFVLEFVVKDDDPEGYLDKHTILEAQDLETGLFALASDAYVDSGRALCAVRYGMEGYQDHLEAKEKNITVSELRKEREAAEQEKYGNEYY